jgi:hypothetical protein
MKGKHSKKTAAFVRTCVAFSFITTPSINNITQRLELYLVSAQVAIANQVLTQGDACYKAAIKLVTEGHGEEHKDVMTPVYMESFFKTFLSSLLIVPDNPEQEPLYILKGLMNAMDDYPWPEDNDAKARIYVDAIGLLSAYGQESYVYTAHLVEANDQLYLSNPKFIAQVTIMIGVFIEKVMDHLKMLHTNAARQWKVSMALLERIVISADLNNVKIQILIHQFFKLAKQASVTTTRQTSFLKLIQDMAEREDPVPGAGELLVRCSAK